MSHIVELVGLPGSGKTSMIRELRYHGGVQVVDGSDAAKLGKTGVSGAVRLVLRTPLLSLSCFLLLASLRALNKQGLKQAVVFLRRLQWLVWVRSTSLCSPVIVDEGPVHGLFTIIYGRTTRLLDHLLIRNLLQRIASTTDTLVFFDVEQARCLVRLRQRYQASSRFSREKFGDVEAARFLSDRSYQLLLAEVEKCSDIHIFKLPEAETRAESIVQIARGSKS